MSPPLYARAGVRRKSGNLSNCGFVDLLIGGVLSMNSTEQRADKSTIPFSNGQRPIHFVVLSIVSFGLYPPYWLYRNLRAIALHRGMSISPFWRTFGAFIPLAGLFIFADQLRFFASMARGSGVEAGYSPWLLTIGFFAASVFVLLPDPWWLVGILSPLALVPVQRALNAYWAAEQPGMQVRNGYSGGEVVLILVCLILWAIVVTALFITERRVIVVA